MSTRIFNGLGAPSIPFALSLSKGASPPANGLWWSALRQAQGERWWAVAALPLALTACDTRLPDKVADAKAARNARAMAEAEGKIECLTPGAKAFAYTCTIDRTQSQDGLYLTLRHPDGGFRRLLVTKDGRGVIAADGAEPAQVTPLADDLIEVSIAGAHYRLPATVRGPKKAK